MIWDLPGPNRFLGAVTSNIEARRHVIVVLPATVDRQRFCGGLRAELRHADLAELCALDVAPHGDEPCLAIAAALGLDASPYGTVERLLACSEVPASVLVLRDLDTIPESSVHRWARFLREAGEDAQVRGSPPFLLVALVSPGFPLPREDVRLARLDWWGVFGRADLETALEKAFLDMPPRNGTLAVWLRALCRGVAVTDPSLIWQIVEATPTTTAELARVLGEARVGAHTRAGLPAVRRTKLSRRPTLRPPADGDEIDHWRNGLIDEFDGARLLHPACLAGQNDVAELARMVWAGQVEVLLPLVEDVRAAVVTWLGRENGPDWPKQFANTEDEPMGESTELGRLLHAARTTPFGRALPGTLRSLLSSWVGLRNDLAHRRMVGFAQLESAFDVHDRFFG